MHRETYTLQGKITGQTYRDLLSFSIEYCETFILVIRSTIELSEKATAALSLLSPFILSSGEKSSWPGTELLAETAKVNEYKFCEDSLDIVLQLSDGLYDWKQPDLPEDLGFFRKDNSVFLGCIAHEADAFLNLSHEERHNFEKKIPEIRLETAIGLEEK